MFIEKTISGYVGAEQVVRRARFLILLEGADGQTYAIVRRVALQQFGAWMMGRANIGGRWVVVSGAYGADGLTMDWRNKQLPRDARQLPKFLVNCWNKGGGWNSAGAEAPLMREWANFHFPKNGNKISNTGLVVSNLSL